MAKVQEQMQQQTRPVFTSVAAHLYVTDLKASIGFFNRLGFAVDFLYGEPPFYGQVSRDQARLALRFMDEPVFAGSIQEREELLSASITLGKADEIEQLFSDYQEADVVIHQVLQEEPWGAKTFMVKDPDGNLILFAGPVV